MFYPSFQYLFLLVAALTCFHYKVVSNAALLEVRVLGCLTRKSIGK